MSRQSFRKQRKQKAREKADAKRKHVADEQRLYSRKFPKFVFRENGAPPQFVALVKKAIQQIDFRDPRLFTAWETEFYKKSKEYGPVVIHDLLRQAGENPLVGMSFVCKLGQHVFSMIPQTELLKWIPYHDVQILPNGQKILVAFRSLRTAKTSGGTVYYSRYKPSIEINRQRKVIGFTDHAIKRICERIVPTWQTYAGLGDAFAYFDQCVYFRRTELPDGQLALTFFDQCRKGHFFWKYVEEILGEDVEDDGHYYRRIGYCPAVVEGDFIKMKTLLFPGHRNTPEHLLAWASDVPVEIKRQVEDMDAIWLFLTEDFRLVKYFHERGVPQAIHDERELFKPAI